MAFRIDGEWRSSCVVLLWLRVVLHRAPACSLPSASANRLQPSFSSTGCALLNEDQHSGTGCG